jgi:heterotetrameric sarcosine oxidase gamma subunit
MGYCQLRITRTPLRSVSLLQIHQQELQSAALCAGSPFTDSPPGHSATQGPRAYAIGPAEWLLIDYGLQDLRRQLLRQSGQAVIRLTDMSSAFASLKIEGSAARTVLASDIGAPSAAHSSEPGQYVRTRLGQVEVVLQCVGAEAFELHVDRSLADYLEGWLEARYAEHADPGEGIARH